MHDTDAAGVIFFANQLKLTHDAYEIFLEEIGYSLQDILSTKDYLLLIAHCQADFKKPITVGDTLLISVKPGQIGTSSFTLDYELVNQRRQLVGTVQTVHVLVDKIQRESKPLPADLRKALRGKTIRC